MKKKLALLAFLVLSSCAAVEGLGSGATEGSPMFSAVRQIGSGIFSRGRGEAPPQFTATRASLNAAGITRPVLVARLDAVGISVGLLEFQTPRDVIVWRSLDGNTITTAGGLLRNTAAATRIVEWRTRGIFPALSWTRRAGSDRDASALLPVTARNPRNRRCFGPCL